MWPLLVDDFVPPNRPRSRYARLDGETLVDTAPRTNEYRLQMLLELRRLLGDLSFLDVPFEREDDLSWNQVIAPDMEAGAGADELYDDGSGRAGALDAVFMLLDETLDDLCGLRELPRRTCGAEPVRIDALAPGDPTGSTCERAGDFERDPNGYYPGVYYNSAVGPPVPLTFDPYGPDALAEFTATLDARDVLYNDDVAPGRAALAAMGSDEEPGLLGLLLRGVRASGSSIYRDADHVCTAMDLFECSGVRVFHASDPVAGPSLGRRRADRQRAGRLPARAPRREAVDRMADLGECLGDPEPHDADDTIRPLDPNPNCTLPDAHLGHIARANTIEALRVRAGRADVLGRDNP